MAKGLRRSKGSRNRGNFFRQGRELPLKQADKSRSATEDNSESLKPKATDSHILGDADACRPLAQPSEETNEEVHISDAIKQGIALVTNLDAGQFPAIFD